MDISAIIAVEEVSEDEMDTGVINHAVLVDINVDIVVAVTEDHEDAAEAPIHHMDAIRTVCLNQ